MQKTHYWILVFTMFLLPFHASALAQTGHEKEGHHATKPQYKEKVHGKRKHEASCWMSSLNKEQQGTAEKMRLEFNKTKALLVAQVTVKKVELATLVTQETIDQNAINKKIDEILELKKEKLQKKYTFKVNMRKMLTPEQRVLFDNQLFKKALHGKGHGHQKKH